MRLRVVAVTLEKVPPMITFPSACNVTLLTVLFEFGLKSVSSVPSALNRATRLRVADVPGFTVVKAPPKMILPSDWTTMLFTAEVEIGLITLGLTFGLKASGLPDQGSSRAIRF